MIAQAYDNSPKQAAKSYPENSAIACTRKHTTADVILNLMNEIADYSSIVSAKTYDTLARVMNNSGVCEDEIMEKHETMPELFEAMYWILMKIKNNLIDIESKLERAEI